MKSTRSVTVNVTADDIAKGKPTCGSSCPVALAIRRTVGYVYNVDDDVIELRPEDYTKSPREVIEFIENFDESCTEGSCGLCKPFSFTLDVPS